MKRILNFLGIVSLFFLPINQAYAKDYVWIIGGGASPDSSQISIEKNIKWINAIIKKLPGESVVKLYFNDGVNGNIKDVVMSAESKEEKYTLQPLARVFGMQLDNNKVYRTNALQNQNKGSTSKDQLMASLQSDFSVLNNEARVLIVFNGHGLKGDSSEGGNTIRVWMDEQISVKEMDMILSHIPERVPVRFIFPQCYSGGFYRLVNMNVEKKSSLSGFNRCGFFAESENKESEG